MVKVSVVILNYNGSEFIDNCLKSVKQLKKDNFELETIVIDNKSKDSSDLLIEKKHPDVKLIRNAFNLGFAEGNNVGIRYALTSGTDYVMLLNPDTFVDKSLIINLVNFAQKDRSIGIISPKIYFASGFEFHKDRYKESEKGKVIWYAGGIIDWKNLLAVHRGVDEVDHGQFDVPVETDFATGCCLLVKKNVFQKIGFLDKKYFLYWEDNDFCRRAKKAGFKIYYVPEGFLYHLNAGSSSSGSELQDYYISRNRMLYGFRYAPFRTKFALIKESINLFFFGRKFQKIGIRDFYFSKFERGSYK